MSIVCYPRLASKYALKIGYGLYNVTNQQDRRRAMREPTYGWDAIRSYFAALPDHLEKVLSKTLSEMRIT